MPLEQATPMKDGDLMAAIDIGSNSFHMVVARYVLGQLRIVDRIKETVRLAEGLDGSGGLKPEVIQRALDCLSRFGQRIRTIPPQHVRAIATNTVRALKSPQIFLLPAEKALGHGIEVVAGREEARLIYLGVANGQPPREKRRLVMDIGGGSTEFIIGEGFEALERESLRNRVVDDKAAKAAAVRVAQSYKEVEFVNRFNRAMHAMVDFAQSYDENRAVDVRRLKIVKKALRDLEQDEWFKDLKNR